MDAKASGTVGGTRRGWETSPTSARFANLVPVRDDYATSSIGEGFNWDEVLGGARDFRAYLVVFRSVRREGADVERLVFHDDRAHDEARLSDGFLYYFKGDVARDRFCLSFCLWESREQASVAASGVCHRLAIAITEEMYEHYELERYDLFGDGDSLVFSPVKPRPS